MRVRPFWPFAFRCLLLVALAGGVGGLILYRQFERHLQELLEEENLRSTRLAAMCLSSLPLVIGSVQDLATQADARVTVIALDGTILADSASDPGSMENHAQRPEIERAIRSGHAHAVRRSSTLGVDMLYTAVRLDAPADAPSRVVRLARPVQHLRQRTLSLDGLVWTSIPVVVLLGVLALYVLIEMRIAESRESSR